MASVVNIRSLTAPRPGRLNNTAGWATHIGGDAVGKLGKIAVIGSLISFARSQQGRELTAKAKTYLNDPQNRQRIAAAAKKFTGR